MESADSGYLRIADTTGYTRYPKLAPARGNLEEPFAARLGQLNSPFTVSGFRGYTILAARAPAARAIAAHRAVR